MVLRGLASEWTALSRWSFEYLKTAFGDVRVTTAIVERGAVVMNDRKGLCLEAVTLGGFLDSLSAGSGERYVMARLADLPIQLTRDAPFPRYGLGAGWRDSNLWIGAPGTVSGLHFDLADNLHVQVSGRKRFTLVSPDDSASVYPRGLFDGVPNGCRVDPERPDFERFPRLRSVQTQVAEISPGDAIYIPRGWWHHVRTLDVSVSVNFWWASGLRRAIVEAADLFKRVRGVSR